MNQSRLRLSLVLTLIFLGLASFSQAQTNSCNNPTLILSGAISTSSGTTTKLVDNHLNTTKSVTVCSFTITLVGAATAQTVVFEYGTGSNCGTGKTVLTGPLSASTSGASTTVISSAAIPFNTLPLVNDLCLVTTTADVVAGMFTYILQ